jgi:hypothetical protein
MTMAEHAAAIGRVYLNRLRDSGKAESWAWKEIAHNGLQVAAGEAAARLKGWETRRQPARRSVNHCVYMYF